MTILTPNQQLKILELIWGTEENSEGGYVFLPFIPTGGVDQASRGKLWRDGDSIEWPQDREMVLRRLNSHKNDELYFSCNLFTHTERKAYAVGEERVLYADLDDIDPRISIEQELWPSILWESSPGRFQGVWLLNKGWIGASDRRGLNHRLTDYVNADPSGYDCTQVLRVPGRLNFKPAYREANDGKPVQGQLIWARKKYFDPEWLDSILPELPEDEYVDEAELEDLDSVDRFDVWARVKRKLTPQVKELMSLKEWQVEAGDYDRSGVLWQIGRDLADAGCTVSEIMAILWYCPFNKFRDRQNGIQAIRDGAIRAKSKSIAEGREEAPLGAEDVAIRKPGGPKWLTDAMALPTRRPNWLVKNIWMKSSVGFIAGAPKSYKSWFALDMAISVAMNLPFLNDEIQFRVNGDRKVLYLQEEDTQGLVFHRVNQIIDGKDPQLSPGGWFDSFKVNPPKRDSGVLADVLEGDYVGPTPNESLALHVREGFVVSSPGWQDWLDEFIREYGFELVVIDTLGTTAGDIDTDKAQVLNERVLKPLKEIAADRDCAIVIVHHNRKAADGNGRSGQQMLGSVALHAWIESALYLTAEDTVTGSPAVVKVHAENKLSEGMKFRVKIPRMYEDWITDKADRQVWEPEILPGWAEDTPKEEKAQADVEDKPTRSRAGMKIAERFKVFGAKGGTFEQLMESDDELKEGRRKQYQKELADAVRNGYLLLEDDGVYVCLL